MVLLLVSRFPIFSLARKSSSFSPSPTPSFGYGRRQPIVIASLSFCRLFLVVMPLAFSSNVYGRQFLRSWPVFLASLWLLARWLRRRLRQIPACAWQDLGFFFFLLFCPFVVWAFGFPQLYWAYLLSLVLYHCLSMKLFTFDQKKEQIDWLGLKRVLS